MIDLKTEYNTILTKINNEIVKLDEKIKQATTTLKAEKQGLESQAKKVKRLLEETSGIAPVKRTRTKQAK